MEIGEKIRELRKEKGYTFKKLSELTSIPIGTLSDIERGRIKIPGIKIMSLLSNALSYDFTNEIISKNLNTASNPKADTNGEQKEGTIIDNEELKSTVEIIENRPNPLPVYYVWAGEPSPTFYEIPSQTIADLGVLAAGFDFIIKIRGDSMTKKGLFEGDTCLGKRVQYASQLRDGDVVAVISSGNYTMLKSFHKNDGDWLLEWHDGSERKVRFTEDMEILGVIKIKLSVTRINNYT